MTEEEHNAHNNAEEPQVAPVEPNPITTVSVDVPPENPKVIILTNC